MSKQVMVGMLAETSIHVGAGQIMGAVDLPVAREAATQYPFIPGSSLKGSLREKVGQTSEQKANEYFGSPGSAAGIGVSDGRLLLLPIRSLTGHYRWVTCPYLIERFARDMQLIGRTIELPDFEVKEEQAWLTSDESVLLLEELTFQSIQKKRECGELIASIRALISHDSVNKRLASYLTVVSDVDFAVMAQRGLFIYARNVLDQETKQSKNLWYEEALPADSLLYTLLFARNAEQEQHLHRFIQDLTDHPYLQVGGNETIGQGWMILASDRGVKR